MDKQSVVLGCGCEVYGNEAEELKQRFRLLRLLIVSTVLSMPLLWDLPPRFQFVLATALQFGPGLYYIRNAIRALKNRSLGMDLLVALSATAIVTTIITATALSLISLGHLYAAGAGTGGENFAVVKPYFHETMLKTSFSAHLSAENRQRSWVSESSTICLSQPTYPYSPTTTTFSKSSLRVGTVARQQQSTRRRLPCRS